MSSLLHQLRSSGALGSSELDAATRRQQIYGGSLDTVLLELSLLEPQVLDAQLAAAHGLGTASAQLLEPGHERPWHAVPSAVADLGWAVPLAEQDGKVVVAIHPEIPDDQMDRLRATGGAMRFVVTAECALARVASERTGALTPQRYAVLAARYILALGGAAHPAPSQQPGAPWRRGEADTTGNATLAPGSTVKRTSGPLLPPPSHPSGKTPSWGRQPEPEPEPLSAPQATPEPARIPRPISVPRQSPDQAIPSFVPPTSSALFGGVLNEQEPPPADQVDLAPIIGTLDQAENRDQVTDALFAGLEALFERAGLFAVRKNKLKVLKVSDRFRQSGANDLPLSPALAEFARSTDGAIMRSLDDPDLRRVLGQAGPVSCAATAVLVAGRPVLLAYGDLIGRAVDDAHAQRAAKLCERAGQALTRVVQSKKSEANKAAPVSPPAPGPVAQPPKPSALPPIEGPRTSTPPPSVAPPSLPRLIDRPPARNNTLISTKAPVDRPLTPLAAPPVQELGAPTPLARILTPAPAPPVRAPAGPAAPLGDPPRSQPPAAPSPDLPPVRTPPRGSSLSDVAPPVRRTAQVTPTPAEAGAPPVRRTAQATSSPAEAGAPPVRRTGAAVPPVRRGTPDAPQTLVPSRAGGQDSTMRPRSGAVPPVRHNPIEPPAGRAVRPSRSPTIEAPAVSPRLEPANVQAPPRMVPLGPPLTQPSSRGALQFDDEDRHDDSQERVTTGVQDRDRLDAAIDAAIRNPEGIPRLLELGEPALARVAARFPGPLDLIKRDLNSLPPLPAHGPLIRLTLSIGARMGPRIRELLDHPDAQVRFYASFAFQELRDESALAALATRAFDPDGDVRTIAMRVLETYSRAPDFSNRAAAVRAELRSANQTRQVHAARAVGTLRDVNAVPDLINLLDDPEKRVRDIGLEALCSVTGQQLGARAGRWRSWWAANADRSRVEWVIDALSHKETAVRRWASSELRRITGQPYALPAEGSKSEREVVVRQWKDWWERTGRDDFG